MPCVADPAATLPIASTPAASLASATVQPDLGRELIERVKPLWALPMQLQAVAMHAMGLDEEELRAMDQPS